MSSDPEQQQASESAAVPALPWEKTDRDAWAVAVELNGQPAKGSVRLVTASGHWHFSAETRVGIVNAHGGPFHAYQVQAYTAALILEMVRCGTIIDAPTATHRSCRTCGTRLPIAWRGALGGPGFSAAGRCPVCAAEMVAEVLT